MPRRRRDDIDDLDSEEAEGYTDRDSKRGRSTHFIDDAAEEEAEYGEEDDCDSRRQARRSAVEKFIDYEVLVDSDDEGDDEEDGDSDFINDGGADLPDEEDEERRVYRPPLLEEYDEEDPDSLERMVNAKYSNLVHKTCDEKFTNVDQQALLPAAWDLKLWMVKCVTGHEREAALCLMQKCIDKRFELKITAAIALDHLKNYIYVEAYSEVHVKEACKGLRHINSMHVMRVPIKEMADVLSVQSKAIELARDTWVRMKSGTYKGDLAKVVDVDDVGRRVRVKIVPRIDLQAIANKLEGREVKKKAHVPPPRRFNVEDARKMHIHVHLSRDRETGERFENVDGQLFKDGLLYKTVSIKSVSSRNIQPTFDEIEKFMPPGENGIGDMASLTMNRKKWHFVKGDPVIVDKGDLQKLKGRVDRIEQEIVHIRAEADDGLPSTVAVNEKYLCKYFEPGNHIKVVSGKLEGATGMVIKVDGHVLVVLSDTTNEHIRVFADNAVMSSEVTSGITHIGEFELHDLVLLDDRSFGVIIRVESGAFQVLKGIPDGPEVVHVKLSEVKNKIKKRFTAQDRYKNTVSVKDVVRILEGPCKGKQGTVEHMYRGILFIYDRHNLEHAGFICAESRSCIVVGGLHTNRGFGGTHVNSLVSRSAQSRAPTHSPQSLMNRVVKNRGGRGHDSLVGNTIRISQGLYKSHKGRVTKVGGESVWVELESSMKVVIVGRNQISDKSAGSTQFQHGMGSETPMHTLQTPPRSCTTPLRDVGGAWSTCSATPIHEGMRTPMRHGAWSPCTPTSPRIASPN